MAAKRERAIRAVAWLLRWRVILLGFTSCFKQTSAVENICAQDGEGKTLHVHFMLTVLHSVFISGFHSGLQACIVNWVHVSCISNSTCTFFKLSGMVCFANPNWFTVTYTNSTHKCITYTDVAKTNVDQKPIIRFPSLIRLSLPFCNADAGNAFPTTYCLWVHSFGLGT